MSETALHEVVFDYVSKIPDTIQKDILVFVVVYACRKVVAAGDDFVEIVRRFLLEQDSEMATFGVVLCTVTALDHVVTQLAINAESNEPALRAIAEKNLVTKGSCKELLFGENTSIRRVRSARCVPSLAPGFLSPR
jgi:hypothetical protein